MCAMALCTAMCIEVEAKLAVLFDVFFLTAIVVYGIVLLIETSVKDNIIAVCNDFLYQLEMH